MTNKDKLVTAVYLCGTEKQALMQKAKALGMKGLGRVADLSISAAQALEGGAPAIGNRFKNLGMGAKEGIRDTGNFLGGLMGKSKLFGETMKQPGQAFGMGRKAIPFTLGLGGALEGGRQISNGVTKAKSTYDNKLRAEGSASGAASAQKGMKDQVDQNGYMRNLMNAIMNKPLGQ